MNNIPIPANYHDILLKPEHNILIMGDKVGEFAGGLVNLRYQQMVPDEDNTPMDECWRAWEKALSSIYVLVPTRPDWLGTLTMLDLDRVKDKDFIKKHILELDLIGDISTDNLNELADKIRRQTGVDKFDFIIGNPPYQESTKGANNFYRPIYPYFMDLSYILSDKAVLVTPARFLFNAGATSKKWNAEMLNDSHLKVLKYFENSKTVFSNAAVAGGIVVTLRDKKENFGKIKVFINDPELKKIFQIMSKFSYQSLSSIITPRSYFHWSNKFIQKNNPHKKFLTSNAFEKYNNFFSDLKSNNDLKIYGLLYRNRAIKFIEKEYIRDSSYINAYKVFLPKAGDFRFPGKILGKSIIGEKGSISTETYLGVGPFKTKKEAINCERYLESKFVRILVHIKKKTPDTSRHSFEFVPMQDFSDNSDINWNVNRLILDQQLYNKYKIPLHESTWIEQNITEMN